MDHIESFQIHLNSKYLSQGTINNAFFYIQTIEVPSDYQLHLSVINASIPYSFYNVNSNNNKLVIYFSESMSTTYLFNTGNYTINQFLTELQSKLVGFTITYDKIKSKLTLAYTTNFTISTTSTCLDILGFGDVSASLLSRINNTTTSINCINLQAFQCICVHFLVARGNIFVFFEALPEYFFRFRKVFRCHDFYGSIFKKALPQ